MEMERKMKLERRAWLRGSWEILKEILLQKLLTYHIHSSPLVLPNHLVGLNVIVTGATSGIGLHTARELAMAGAHLVMACRNVKAAGEILRQWREEVADERALNVKIMELDLASLSSVRQFAADWDQASLPLHILINNAGIGGSGEKEQFTKDGIEQHMQVNHVATALLTLLLLPSMLRANTWRLVHVNSMGHFWGVVDVKSWSNGVKEKNYSPVKAYGSSKLAHMMFMKALSSHLVDQGLTSVQCVAVHPGIVSTNLSSDFKGKSFLRLDSSEGARIVLHCASSESVTRNTAKGFTYYSSNYKAGKFSSKAKRLEDCLYVWEATLRILGLNLDYLSNLSKVSNPNGSREKVAASSNASTSS